MCCRNFPWQRSLTLYTPAHVEITLALWDTHRHILIPKLHLINTDMIPDICVHTHTLHISNPQLSLKNIFWHI